MGRQALVFSVALFFLGCSESAPPEPIEPIAAETTYDLKLTLFQKGGFTETAFPGVVKSIKENGRFKAIVVNQSYLGPYDPSKNYAHLWSLTKPPFFSSENYEGTVSCCSTEISFRDPSMVPDGLGIPYRRLFIDAGWDSGRLVDAVIESYDTPEIAGENSENIARAKAEYTAAHAEERAAEKAAKSAAYMAAFYACMSRRANENVNLIAVCSAEAQAQSGRQ